METKLKSVDDIVRLYQRLNHNNAGELVPLINNSFLPPGFQQPFHKRIDDFLSILSSACLSMADLQGFIKKIERDDIIEIYEPSSVQYWRSYNFFEKCSYTPEELFFTPWYELFERPDHINALILEFVQQVMNEGLSNVKFPVPKHLLKETRGARNIIELEPRFCSVLYQKDGRLFGMVNTVRASVRKQKTFLQPV